MTDAPIAMGARSAFFPRDRFHRLLNSDRSLSQKTSGYCWPTPQRRNLCVQHAFFEGKKAEKTSLRESTHRTLKPGRLRARSCRPFLPAPHRTGLDTCRIIRLSGFLVSLTLAYGNGCRHDIVCRAECSCVFGIS